MEVTIMNLHLKHFSMAMTLLDLAFFMTAPALAHHPELKTQFTVDERTMVPGATLEPNTSYVLNVMKSDSERADRHVVQILQEDGNKMLTSFLGVSDEQNRGPEGFTFMEMNAPHDKVVREWVHPEWGGLKFVYSEQEARDISQNSNESVLWTRSRVTTGTSNLESIQVSTLEAGTDTTSNQVARNEPSDLPRTAGELPLLGLIGIASLAAAFAMRLAVSRK
jgi:hypothetical protein